MRWLILGLVFFAIGTQWIESYWPQAVLFVAFAAIVLLQLIQWVQSRTTWPLHWLAMIPGLICAWASLQLVMGWSVYPHKTHLEIMYWGTSALAVVASYACFRSQKADSESFLKGLFLGSAALAIVSTIHYFSSPGRIFWWFPTWYSGPTLGSYLNRDHYATFVALVLPIGVYQALKSRHQRTLYTVLAAAMFASVVAGASRAGSTIVALEMAVLLSPRFFADAGQRQLRATLLRVLVFASVFSAVVGISYLIERFRAPDPFAGRREMLIASLAMWRQRPLTGFGLGTWPDVYPAFSIWDPGLFVNHAHNDWAEMLAEGGLAGFTLMALLALWAMKTALQLPWSLGIAAALTHAFVDFPLQKYSIAILLFVLAGTAAAVQTNSRGKRKTTG